MSHSEVFQHANIPHVENELENDEELNEELNVAEDLHDDLQWVLELVDLRPNPEYLNSLIVRNCVRNCLNLMDNAYRARINNSLMNNEPLVDNNTDNTNDDNLIAPG